MWLRIKRWYGRAWASVMILIGILGIVILISVLIPALRTPWLLDAFLICFIAALLDGLGLLIILGSQRLLLFLRTRYPRAWLWVVFILALVIGTLTYTFLRLTSNFLSGHQQFLALAYILGAAGMIFRARIILENGHRLES